MLISLKIAETVVKYGYYPSTQVDADDYVSFISSVFPGGAYKVFFKRFDFFDYGLSVSYTYDPSLTSNDIVQSAQLS